VYCDPHYGDAQLAEDVAQGVFTTLAQKAAGLGSSCVVGGWLYHTTRNLALHALRTEHRRRAREQTAVALQSLETFFQWCAAEFAKPGRPDMDRITAISAEHGIHYVQPAD